MMLWYMLYVERAPIITLFSFHVFVKTLLVSIIICAQDVSFHIEKRAMKEYFDSKLGGCPCVYTFVEHIHLYELLFLKAQLPIEK